MAKVFRPSALRSIGIHLYLLDEDQREVAEGETGEIFLGGAGVARGYRNRPDLTAERFLDDPFQAEGRMYRTGDLGRRLTNGAIAFLGRQRRSGQDSRLPDRTGEINAVLNQQASVQASVVVAREDTPARKSSSLT